MNREEVTNHYLEVRGCKIKRTYINKKEAKAAAKRMTRQSERGRLRAYSCNYCPNYHVGHIRPSYEDRKENKRIDTFLKNAV
jgi:hypothetical protein